VSDIILFGDCRESLAFFASSGFRARTCVTSPPYFGLRDYGHDGQLGLEPTPAEYVAAMVDVFRGVWDVLTDDGTLWLNIGDTYCTVPHGPKGANSPDPKNPDARKRGGNAANRNTLIGVKHKDLIGIPWMLAFALRDAGWYLRQEIIWQKPNPMPESVTDRCTKAHEQIFLFSKRPSYYFDHEAIKEPVAETSKSRLAQNVAAQAGSTRVPGKTNGNMKAVGDGKTRNRRSVWTVATRPYRLAHFATFPSALIEPCVLAGSAPGDTVLDPFMGSGTTAQVAKQHGRFYLGCELNPEYEVLQKERLKGY
jgi:DNA modification methylase